MPIIDRIRDRERIFRDVERIDGEGPPPEEVKRINGEEPLPEDVERIEEQPEEEKGECNKDQLQEILYELRGDGPPSISREESQKIMDIAITDTKRAFRELYFLLQQQSWRWEFVKQCAFGGESEGS